MRQASIYAKFSRIVSPLLLLFASGEMFFIGLGLAAASSIAKLRRTGKIASYLLTALWILGFCLVILSATPLSLWVYVLWLGSGIALPVIHILKVSPAWEKRATAAFVAIALAMSAAELRHQLPPSLPVLADHPIFVVGDSISAGIRTGARTWPEVLADHSHLQVVNLSRAGATVDSALTQLNGVTDPDALLIVEIGGNDLLTDEDGRVFRAHLDAFLGRATQKSRHLAMFELPLFPFYNAYGRAQRDLAERYGVTLIPKRCLTRVFGMKDGTLDGLHLSQKGHDVLAQTLAGFLKVK